ncbi:MAG TPA: aldose epimerase [Cyanobacteria bacterium UBA11369]|nr:aldose epimerase [Cyanobacteria bacterium UBA11368]HBE49741.1 aldose epimerase [Cyanobacteria bacterium UBA11369]
MFAIAIEQQQYQTYILSDSSTESRLEVVPQRGGMIARWQVQGEDILYLDAERFADPNLSVRGGIPILFPICGNLPDNTYTYQGKQYTLKQHGFARDMPWEVVDQVTQDLVSLTLVLNSNDQTRAVYPFEFQLAFTYELLGNCLNIRQRYTNHSTEPMPFSTGLHPYFLTTDKTQLQFDIPASEYQDQRTKITHYFNGNFDFDADEIDVAFQKLTSNSASVTDTTRRMQLTLDYDDAYSAVVFWTVKGKRYYCVEPWTATRNALNTGENLIYLDPGASLETLVRLTVNFSEK